MSAATRPTTEPTPTPRGGVALHLPYGAPLLVSESWRMGAWHISFARIAAHEALALDPSLGTPYVKVIAGTLAEPERGAFAPAGTVRGTRVEGGGIRAGSAGAVVAIFQASEGASLPVRSLGALAIAGPHDEALTWRSFGAALPQFAGLDAHFAPGFHLIDGDGGEIAYVFTWAAGPGVDMTTHNHGKPTPARPAFAEVHLVLHKGGPGGGMYETPAPGSAERQWTPLQPGEEHGPFFAVDPQTGRPLRGENGCVVYPWHSWQAGPAVGAAADDVVVAIEISPDYAVVEA